MIKILKQRSSIVKRGFTLTEVLLAVMIVGLIGVALASLTRAAAREGGVGRSKILLRNNLSSFMRGLRNDLAASSTVTPKGVISSTDSVVELLKIGKNVTRSGEALPMDPNNSTPAWVLYCFEAGSDASNIEPSNATRGGKIYRIESSNKTTTCSTTTGITKRLALENVKYIPNGGTYNYPVPLFKQNEFSRESNLLTVHIITELPSTPIVNDVVEENLTAPMGY